MDDTDLAATVRAAAGGDTAAFAAVVRATQSDVARACAALVDRDSAEDLSQETYLRAFRALPSFTGESSLRTWVLGIARHVCIDELRRRTRRRAALRLLPPRSEALELSGATDLELLVRALPAEQREAFVLTQLIGLSYDATARVCDTPVGTVRSRVARARVALIAEIGLTQRAAE